MHYLGLLPIDSLPTIIGSLASLQKNINISYFMATQPNMASLIAGEIVDIETVTKDRYGRTVGIVTSGGSNINQEMVWSGCAWVYRRYCDKPFCNFWLELEDEAKSGRSGLWQEANPIPPWEWRKRK